MYIIYLSNKKFREYQNYLLLKELAIINKTSSGRLIDEFIKSKNLHSDEDKLRRVSLKKYWKEPMAWH